MAKERLLSHEEARQFYDWLGAGLDLQRVFEDPAMDALLAHADFEQARAVVEFGCGTGRLGARLLRGHLAARATYEGFDISRAMVDLTRARLEPWMDRARVHLTDGTLRLPLDDRSCDRFLSTYVLDLLGQDDIRTVLREAGRVLVPDGRLCLATMTFGERLPSRIVNSVWSAIHSASPRLVGGSRPIRLEVFTRSEWQVLHREVVCAFGMCTEVLVARPPRRPRCRQWRRRP